MNRLLKFVILLFLFSASYLQVKSQRQIYAVIVGVSDYKNDNLVKVFCDQMNVQLIKH